MKQSNSAVKKIDTLWSVFSIIFISAALFFWQTGQGYFLYILLAAVGIVNSIKELIPKIFFNILIEKVFK